MAQHSNKNSFKNIENTLDELNTAAWVWDCNRNRIIAANGAAVKFWQELSVLDLIDTLFGEYHPVSLQFAKGAARLNDDDNEGLSVDLSSMDIAEKQNCAFSAIDTDDGRNLLLIEVMETQVSVEAIAAAAETYNDEMVARMLDNAPVALALFDQDGKFHYANANCQQIFIKPTDIFSAPEELSDWFTGETETLDEVKLNVQNLIEKCLKYKIANISTKLNTAFGARTHSIVAKSFVIEPFRNGQQFVLVYLRDVADERRYEQILVERIAKLEQLTKLGSDFYFILDSDLDFVQLGGNFEKLTGYAASELLGENWQTIAERFDLDPTGVASEFFSGQKSFDNLSIEWPVKDSDETLALTWRGRSIFEQQNDENIFIGSFVAAFENILFVPDDDLTQDIGEIAGDVELLADDDQDIDAETDLYTDADIDTDADLDKFEDLAEIAALAELDGASDADLYDEQTSDLELSTLETDLNDAEAVNFASIGETLNETTEAEALADDTLVEKTLVEKNLADNTADEEVQAVENDRQENSLIEAENVEADNIDDVLARSDDVIAEINEILGETDDTGLADNDGLADNIVPAFGTTAEDIKRFGRTEVDMFKLILDQTPVMTVITSLPSEDGIFTLFANKEVLHNLGLIQDKNQDLPNEDYMNLLSVESMEYINSLKAEFSETPLDQEISFLVKGDKQYFNAKISKIDWQDNKVLQYILSPKLRLDTMDADQALNPNKSKPVALKIASVSDDVRQQVADYKSANSAKNDSETSLQFILDGQAFIDREQKILSSNIYLSDIVGMSQQELEGKTIGQIVVESDFGTYQDYINSVLQVEEKKPKPRWH